MSDKNKFNIDEKEIDELISEFSEADIKIPEEKLNIELSKKLEVIKSKSIKNKIIKKSIVASLLIITCSYTLISPFRVWANEVVRKILYDIGIQNAVENRLPKIEDVDGEIGDYDIKVHDIYMDEERVKFQVSVDGLEKNKDVESIYRLSIPNEKDNRGGKLGNVVTHISNITYDNTIAYGDIQGEGVKEIIKNKRDIEFILSMSKVKRDTNGNEVIEELGECIITIEVPKELYAEAKNINVNETINVKNGEIKVQNLDIYPTVMKVSFNGVLNDGSILSGIDNLKIEDHKGNMYSNRSNFLRSIDKKGSVTECIIPSIYYSDLESITIKGDGYIYMPSNKNVMVLRLDEQYPKKIVYNNTEITINNLEYEDGKLVISLNKNDNIYKPNFIIDSRSYGYYKDLNHDKVDKYSITIPRKDEYMIDFNFEFIKKENIEFKVNIK